jgi:hypothetical protein
MSDLSSHERRGVTIKIVIFWNATPRSLVDVSQERAASIFRAEASFTLKIEAVCFSEKSLSIY